MGMKTRQEKALDIKDYITKVNALVAELEEEGWEVMFHGKYIYAGSRRSIDGLISDVSIKRVQKLL